MKKTKKDKKDKGDGRKEAVDDDDQEEDEHQISMEDDNDDDEKNSDAGDGGKSGGNEDVDSWDDEAGGDFVQTPGPSRVVKHRKTPRSRSFKTTPPLMSEEESDDDFAPPTSYELNLKHFNSRLLLLGISKRMQQAKG